MSRARVVAGLGTVICLLHITGQAAPTTVYTNTIGMEFVSIPAGTFEMGTHYIPSSSADEAPPHQVTISQPFCLAKQEVTQGQWLRIMEKNPSRFKGENRPVERVSWRDVQEFIRLLNAQEGVTGYRLPTEAEWEYAARAGSTTTYYWGNTERDVEKFAWYEENATGGTHNVGGLQPNAWGLYDMAGNVQEWCQDWYHGRYYTESPERDPTGPAEGYLRVQRGGSWSDETDELRSAARDHMEPGNRNNNTGFRLVGVCP